MPKLLYGPSIDLNDADVFVMKNEQSYAAFLGVLSNIYMKAHASSVYRTVPYKAALIVDSSMLKSYKNQPESAVERIKFIIGLLKQPNGGIEISIFHDNKNIFSEKSKVGLKHTVSHCWPMILPNAKKNIITSNSPPPQLKADSNTVRYFTHKDILSAVGGHKLENINYNTPVAHAFSFLERSKVHICYQGGTAWLSVCAGIPTIIVHPKNSPNQQHLKFRLFGQELGNINILDSNNRISLVAKHPKEHHVNISALNKTVKKFL